MMQAGEERLVLEDLLDVPGLRRLQPFVACGRVVAAGGNRNGGGHELRALVNDRETDVDVEEIHVRREVITDVFDLVVDSQVRIPEAGLYPAPEE